jgi:mono/diheme cytochrome c family protein
MHTDEKPMNRNAGKIHRTIDARRLRAFLFRFLSVSICVYLWLNLPGCIREDMDEQPRHNAESSSDFFPDGSSARPLVEGTVARGFAHVDTWLYDGKVDGQLAASFPDHYPTEIDGPFPTHGEDLRGILQRGQERFTIYCSVCHGQRGDGDGMIVRRGFPRPPSYQSDRLRQAPVGHLFDVISNGYGAMYGYGDRVPPADRWAIVAYIRALQMSQATAADQLDPADAQALQNASK